MRQTIAVAKSGDRSCSGRTVEALVDVIGVEQSPSSHQTNPQGADLATVDKAVQLVFTDGTTAHYEVDQWTLEAGQEISCPHQGTLESDRTP